MQCSQEVKIYTLKIDYKKELKNVLVHLTLNDCKILLVLENGT